jgi:hypothetical protein
MYVYIYTQYPQFQNKLEVHVTGACQASNNIEKNGELFTSDISRRRPKADPLQ